MILRYLVPLLAIAGLIAAVMFTQKQGSPPPAPPRQLAQPPETPYNKTVSGTGIIEAPSRNIQVGSQRSGVVATLNVREGQHVAKGAVLFTLDSREAEAEIRRIQAAVNTASVTLEDEQDQLQRAEGLTLGQSISMDVLQRRRFAVRRASAALQQAQAEVRAAQTTRELNRVTAPIEGKILKVRLRAGEFVTAGSNPAPIVMGSDEALNLRVTIDENDLWRYESAAEAKAVLRSNKEAEFKLKFIGVEPLVLPKKDLSGDPSEKVDTRVLEVIYEIQQPEDSIDLYIGQQMDVFIEGK
jgi:HlyD family secretion protein